MSNQPIFNLEDHTSFVYESDQHTIFLRGIPHPLRGKTDQEEWVSQVRLHLKEETQTFSTWLSNELDRRTGLFSMVIKNGDEVYIAGDIIRRHPVFYGFSEGQLFITDNLHRFQDQYGPFSINNQQLEEYVSSGSVFGDRTIYNEVKAIQPGEVICIKGDQITLSRYFEFRLKNDSSGYSSVGEFSKALDQVFISVFSRMLEQYSDVDRWIVPLSGGHDSRIIVNYLFRLGVKNVICYTYGKLNSEQSILSKQVADALGFDWHMVLYTEKKWQDLHETGMVEECTNYAFNGVSTPHLQDVLAVYELKEKGIVRKGDVFVPGHTFDWMAGSNFTSLDLDCKNKSQAIKRVVNKHFRIKDRSRSPVRSLEEMFDHLQLEPKYFQEYFNWQERRSKFMVNSLKGYEVLGFRSCLPFWDKELADFWLNIADEDRMERKIFHEAENLELLVNSLKAVPFAWKQDPVGHSKIIDVMRNLLPGFVKTLLLRISGRNVQYSEGLNQIYALRASTLKEMLDPIEDFPKEISFYFKDFLKRFPYQVDYHFLTALMAIRNQLDRYVKK